MSVAHDAVSESHTGTTGSINEASFTWNHVPTGTPRSALVFVFTSLAAVHLATSVTYGGVTMTAVPYDASCNSAEKGAVRAYFLDNVASGTQAVVVNRTNSADSCYAVCMTQTAASACEVYNAGVMTQSGATSNTGASSSGDTNTGTAGVKAVDDGSPGTNSQRYMGMFYGGSSVLSAGTGSTSLTTAGAIDFGVYVICTYRETTPGQGARNVGSAAGTDDLALVALAVRESPGTPITGTDSGTGTDTGGMAAAYASSDTGSGSETATGAAAYISTEAATGTDANAVVSVPILATDAATATDASAGLGLGTSDTGTATDTGALAAVTARTDAATATDAASMAAGATVSEAASATDAASLAAAFTQTDTATATETGSLDSGAFLVTASDTATASETAVIEALYAARDSGIGTELAALSAGFVATDTASGEDTATLAALIEALEAGTATDAAAVGSSLALGLAAQVRISAALDWAVAPVSVAPVITSARSI